MGHFDAAATLLAQAYSSRKDTEIAAHLGEALWADGKHDEAARVLRDAHKLDAGNEVLKKTMTRPEGRSVRLRDPRAPARSRSRWLLAGLRHPSAAAAGPRLRRQARACAPTPRPTMPRTPSAASSS